MSFQFQLDLEKDISVADYLNMYGFMNNFRYHFLFIFCIYSSFASFFLNSE